MILQLSWQSIPILSGGFGVRVRCSFCSFVMILQLSWQSNTLLMYGSWVRIPTESPFVQRYLWYRFFFASKFSMMPCCYILFSQKLNKYYVGACIDLERRLYEHNIGHSKFTSTGLPWILKHQENFETLQEAKQREVKIKAMKSRKYIEALITA